MDIVDELTDLSGAPANEVKAVADKAIKEIKRLRDEIFNLKTEVHFDDQTIKSLHEINERLREALRRIADFDLYGDYSNAYEIPKIARAALKEGE